MSGQHYSGSLLAAAAAVGNGAVFRHAYGLLLGCVQLEITGAPTQVVVSIHALLDGATYDTLLTLDTNEGYVSGEIVPISFPVQVRDIYASLDTLTGGTSPTVSCYFQGKE